jgi:LysR family nitrogen assimilation transcriptional regulator
MRTRPLFEEPLWLVSRLSDGAPGRAEADPIELDGAPLVTRGPHTALRQDLSSLCAAVGVQPRVRMEVDDVGAIIALVGARLGLAVLPRSVARALVPSRGLRAIPVRWPPTSRPRAVAAIHLPVPLAPAARRWLEVCEEAARAIGAEPA